MENVSRTKFESVKVGDVFKWTPQHISNWTPQHGNRICIIIKKTDYNVTARYITKCGGYCKCVFTPRDFIIRRYTLVKLLTKVEV
jgi:hypothetical protein